MLKQSYSLRYEQPLDSQRRINFIAILLVKLHGFLNYLISCLTCPSRNEGFKQLSKKDSVMRSPSPIKTLEKCIFLPTLEQGLETVLSALQMPDSILFIPWSFLSLKIPPLQKLLISPPDAQSLSPSILVFCLPAWLLWRESLILFFLIFIFFCNWFLK